MAAKTVGTLIKEARTAAGLSQEALAKLVDNCSASDISKAEHGEKLLGTAQLKQIAKACGVTQKSLLEAPTGAGKSSSSKSESSKSSSSKSSSGSKSESGSKQSSSAKTGSSSKSSSSKDKESEFTLSAAEKKLVEYYRAANSETKKAAVAVLKGEATIDKGLLNTLLTSAAGENGVLGGLLDGLMGSATGKK